MTTFAYFTAEQDNFAQYAGLTEDGIYYYEGVSIESEGYEFEVTGKITDAMNIVASYTILMLQMKMVMTPINGHLAMIVGYNDYTSKVLWDQLPGRWQSKIESTDYNVKQGSYAAKRLRALEY